MIYSAWQQKRDALIFQGYITSNFYSFLYIRNCVNYHFFSCSLYHLLTILFFLPSFLLSSFSVSPLLRNRATFSFLLLCCFMLVFLPSFSVSFFLFRVSAFRVVFFISVERKKWLLVYNKDNSKQIQ